VGFPLFHGAKVREKCPLFSGHILINQNDILQSANHECAVGDPTIEATVEYPNSPVFDY
jgi:hypothetical protein